RTAPDPAWAVAQAPARCDRCGAETPARRLSRPLFLPSPRSHDAGGGNGGGDGRADQTRKGVVLGNIRMAGRKDRPGHRVRPRQWPFGTIDRAAAIQPVAPEPRGARVRAAAAVAWLDHLVAAGLGPAYRQVH